MRKDDRTQANQALQRFGGFGKTRRRISRRAKGSLLANRGCGHNRVNCNALPTCGRTFLVLSHLHRAQRPLSGRSLSLGR